MKKNRYIPYGYTIRNGRTVIEHTEADIIREIFNQYIDGASLKEIADLLTKRKIPYTERSDVWDKARVARIIDNAKYKGNGEYDAIIEKAMYENAVMMKKARQMNNVSAENENISLIKNRVKCEHCNAPMVRHICKRDRIPEHWSCTNPQCGIKVRIPDGQLLEKINILINRIIANNELIKARPREKYTESPTVRAILEDIEKEVIREKASDTYIMDKIRSIATQMYKENNSKENIEAVILQKNIKTMEISKSFKYDYFAAIASYITLNKEGKVSINTKSDTQINEGEESDGSNQDTQKSGDGN